MKQQDSSAINESKTLHFANEEFWANRIVKYNTIPDPYQGLRGTVFKEEKYGRQTRTLGSKEGNRLRTLCSDDEINVFSFLFSCLSLSLSRMTGLGAFLLLTSAFEKKNSDSPLFLERRETKQLDNLLFKEFLMENRQMVIQSIKHQDYDYANVAVKLKAGNHRIPEVMPFSFRYNNTQYCEARLSSVVSFLAEFDDDGSLILKVRSSEECNKAAAYSLLESFETVITAVIQEPKQNVSSILVKLNETDTLGAVHQSLAKEQASRSLVDLWNQRAKEVRTLPSLIMRDRTVFFESFERKIEKLAYHLSNELDIAKGDMVALLLNDPEEMIIGIWAALKSGAAYVPIDPNLPMDRRNFILEDTQPAIVISNAELLLELEGFQGHIFGIDVQLDTLQEGAVTLVPGSEDPAYVIYTSGSTGVPKGVMVSHGSLVNLIMDQVHRIGVTDQDRILNMLPYSFDVAHYHMFMSMLSGACLVDVGSDLIRDPENFYVYLNENKVTIAGIPPAYLATLDVDRLSFLRVVYTGGEAPKRANIDRLIDNQIRVFNQYGLTETTCTSLMYEFEKDKHAELLPVGSPISNTQVYILDESLRPSSLGDKGEMFISGRGLAQGYLNRPELNAQKFIGNPFIKGERLFRTGDLGRRLVSGDIVFLGRADRQVKIRGHRIELREVEKFLGTHEKIQSVAVDVIENKHGQKELVAYFVAHHDLEVKILKVYAQKFLPAYLIPAIFIELDNIPTTSHGKVDFKALAYLAQDRQEETISAPPRNDIERSLVEIWKEVLDRTGIGVHDNFFEIGGHSLNATQVVSTIYQKLRINLELGMMFSHPTIAELATVLEGEEESLPDEIKALDYQEYYEVSHAQKRLWILDRLHRTTAYNIPGAYVFDGLDVAAFKKAFLMLTERQESLRTVFLSVDGEPKQKIIEMGAMKVLIKGRDISNLEDRYDIARGLVMEESAKVFDLEECPLFRATLLQVEDDRHILIFCMHHIISDGWSMTVMVKEIMTLYTACLSGLPNPLKPLKIQYKDFAAWQNNRTQIGKDEHFWLEKLSEGASLVDFPYDYPKADLTSFNGSSENLIISHDKVGQLMALAHDYHCTLSVVVFSIYNILLQQLTGQKEICIAMTVANRTHAAIEKIIGYFANLIIIKTDLSRDLSFEELVTQVRDYLIEAINHQNYPFDLLVEKLNPNRNNDFQPLFNVGYTFQNQQHVNVSMEMEEDGAKVHNDHPGLRVANFDTESKGTTSKFEILLFVEERPEGMHLMMEYNTDLFAADTIKQYLTYFERIIDSLIQTN